MSDKEKLKTAIRGKLLFPLIAVLLLLLSACGAETKKEPVHVDRTVSVFGTTARFSVEGKEAEKAVAECEERLKLISNELNVKNKEGCIARLNAAAGSGEWTKLSPEAWHILSVSQKYSELTDGAWDITIRPLSSLWRKSFKKDTLPSEDDIKAAQEKIGWEKLELREEDKSARLTVQGMGLDLGGVIKGYALDECRRIYEKHKVKGLIDLGTSSIAAVGEKKDGEPFRIALRHPRKEPPEFLGVLPLKNAVLSTSGDYEHFIIKDGIRYHHILDTRTGAPVQNGLSSVSIRISSDEKDAGLLSDILSTAVFVMGKEKALQLLPSLPVKAEASFTDDKGAVSGELGKHIENIK